MAGSQETTHKCRYGTDKCRYGADTWRYGTETCRHGADTWRYGEGSGMLSDVLQFHMYIDIYDI